MNLSTILNDYGILVTAIIGLGMAILGYFFGKWDAERKRNWELEDRKLDRRTKVREGCIEEVRIYLDTYWNVAQSLSIYELFLGAGVEDSVTEEQHNYIFNTMSENRKRVASIYSLDDADLNLLHGVLDAVFDTENQEMESLRDLKTEGKPIDHNTLIKRVDSFNAVMRQYITRMKMRLDELAQNI